MAFADINWITVLITASIGLAGGLFSGILSSLAGRMSMNRKYRTQRDKLDQQIEDKCMQQFEKMRDPDHTDKRKCFECETVIQDEATFCAYCGVPVRGTRMCDSCKIPLPDNAKFCYDCGRDAIDLDDASKAPEPKPEPVPEPEPEEDIVPVPEPEDEPDQEPESIVEELETEVESEPTEELDDQEDVDE